MPTVDTAPVFALHRTWNDAVLAGNAAVQLQAFNQLAALGHDPTSMGLTLAQRRTSLLEWERRRLRFQHSLRSLGMHTLVGPKIPGTVSETSAAYLLDTKGRGRVGQSAGGNGLGGSDLVNGFEVKEAARCFVNIDLVFSGRVVRRGTHIWIEIDQNATDPRTLEQLNGSLAGVMHQMQSNGMAVQRLTANRRCDRDALWKTATAQAILRVGTSAIGARGVRTWDRGAGAWTPINLAYSTASYGGDPLPPDGVYIKLARGSWRNVPAHYDAAEFEFRLTQERPHFNIGNYTGQIFAQMINDGIVFVSRHIDVDGRAAVAFLRLQTSRLADAQALILRRGRPLAGARFQFQPYLYHDNTRNELYDNNSNGLMNLGAELLAYYLEDEDDLQEVFWNPAGVALTNPNIISLLTTSQTGIAVNFPGAGGTLGAPRPITDYDQSVDVGMGPVLFNHQDQAHRHQKMDDFAELLCEYYRDSRYHTDWTNTARKIFSGKECETFASLYAGLRGDRSMARGTDLYENTGQASECKQVTGRRGDMMFTIHPNPPLHLGNPLGILQWNRLFVTSMEDRSPPNPLGLHMKLLVMCADPVLYNDAQAYSVARPNSPDLEYDSENYASGAFGVANARPYLPSGGQIVPNRVFEYREGAGRIAFNPAFIPPCP